MLVLAPEGVLPVKTTPRTVDRLVDEQVQRWLAQQRGPALDGGLDRPHPIVTVSRQAGASGTELARHVATRLGYRLWDQELVQEVAVQAGTWEQLLGAVDERARSAIEDLLTGILVGDALTGEAYAERLTRNTGTLDLEAATDVIVSGYRARFRPARVMHASGP
jgi:hypothetical protein